MKHVMNPARRRILLTGAGAAALTGLEKTGLIATAHAQTAPAGTSEPKALPAYAAWKDADSMIVHSSNTIETKRSAFGTSIVTPSEQLYVRNNVSPPAAQVLDDRNAWQLTVNGVAQPRILSLAELKTMGLETVPMVLQCSGNGRAYFPHKPSGTPWTVGAAGCVLWSGVPVRAVAQALGGVSDGARFMTGTGGETVPEGIDPKSVMVERSVPITAMTDALLAWELNGMPIPLAHGGPLRLIVPGYSGVNSIKYLRQLAFTAQESEAAIQRSRYRMAPVGQKGSTDQPSVWQLDPKSWINSPLPENGMLAPGLVQITGVAFGGNEAVRRVEVSIDDGKTWQDARLIGPDLGKYAWRQFVLPVRLAPGAYMLASRVTDSQGRMQPEHRLDNNGGYSNTSWRDHALRITVGQLS